MLAFTDVRLKYSSIIIEFKFFYPTYDSLRTVSYYFSAPCSNGDLRLVGGNVKNEGRVEICVGNVWGTVCDNHFTNVDAIVVCRKLNYLTTGLN